MYGPSSVKLSWSAEARLSTPLFADVSLAAEQNWVVHLPGDEGCRERVRFAAQIICHARSPRRKMEGSVEPEQSRVERS